MTVASGQYDDLRQPLLERKAELRNSRIERDGNRLFKGWCVIVFGLPGACTPTCASQRLPRCNELAPQLRTHAWATSSVSRSTTHT